jgi:hypothetical protein
VTEDRDSITADQFDEWLAGASLAHTSVEILQNPGLLGEWEDLERRHARAKAIAQAEGGITDGDPLGELEAEAESLLERIEASRTTFHLRALTPEDNAAILAAHPVKPGPRFAGKIPSIQPNHTETQAKAFLGMYASYEAQLNRWKEENAEEIDAHEKDMMDALLRQGAEKVSRSVVRIEQGGRTISTHLSADQVIALEKRIGQPQISAIIAAINTVSETAPEVPTGFLSRTSGSDPASSAG